MSETNCEQERLEFDVTNMDSPSPVTIYPQISDLHDLQQNVPTSGKIHGIEELTDTAEVGNCDNEELSLATLPPEVFLTICSYLPASFILSKLTLVCKSFRDLLMDDATWKIRITKRCLKLYPRVPEPTFDWKQACIEREDAFSRWSQPEETMESYSLKENVDSAVDVVHLMDHGQLLVSGSRDRHLIFWDLKKLDPENPECEDQVKLLKKSNAHKGWIWTVASREHFIASGAWDATIKIWDVGPSCEEIRKITCKAAILCVKYMDHLVVAGGYDQHTYYIDTRTGAIVQRLRQHRRSVLCMAAASDYVITGSEDRTVCVYDQRAGKRLKTITLTNFPMSISRVGNQILVGDKLGLVHLIDANQGKFDVVKTYDVGHSSRVTGIENGYGCTITCSVDKTIRVLEPCDNPSTLATLRLHSQEVAGISYQEGTLASAGSDCQIGVWRPKPNVDI